MGSSGGVCAFAIDLPAIGKAIGGNSRGEHYGKNRAFQAAKDEAVILIRAAMNEHGLYGVTNWMPVTLSITWLYSNAAHRPDPDNAISRVKPYIDAAVAVGLIAGDTPDVIVELSIGYQRAKQPGIRLLFTRVEGQEAA